jgi:uncharacterized protein involved in outer membrane biogenesis
MRWLVLGLAFYCCFASSLAAEDKSSADAATDLPKALLDHLLVSGEQLYAGRVEIVGLEFDTLSASMELKEGVLYLNNIESRMYGGTAQATVAITLEDGSIDIDLRFNDMRLDQFLTCFAGMETPPSGRINGSAKLNLPRGIGNLLVGRAELSMSEGNVISLGTITNALMGNPGAADFQDTAEVVINIANRHATFESFTINNPSVKLFGSGSIAFDGQTNIVFSPHTKPGYLRFLPLAGDILSWGIGSVTESIGRFQVTGHISNPKFTARPF